MKVIEARARWGPSGGPPIGCDFHVEFTEPACVGTGLPDLARGMFAGELREPTIGEVLAATDRASEDRRAPWYHTEARR